jgi:hypothetical protein
LATLRDAYSMVPAVALLGRLATFGWHVEEVAVPTVPVLRLESPA